MNTKIKATNLDLSDQITAFIHDKLSAVEKILDSDDESILCEIEIGKSSNHHNSGDIYRAEINLKTAGHNYRAVEDKDDLENSILKVRDEIIRIVNKNQDKTETLKRRGGTSIKKRLKGLKNL